MSLFSSTRPVRAGPSLSPLRPFSESLPTPRFWKASCQSQAHLRRRHLRIRAIDAAQPYDYESHVRSQFKTNHALKIAIIGFGNYGQFLARTLVEQGHTVLAHSRSDHTLAADSLGVSFYLDPHDLCEQHPEVVLIASSILSTETVLKSIPLQRLRRNTLFVDVLSVKEFPRDLFLNHLPLEFDILCTHPMFGPESGKNSWSGLPFVFDKVRVGSDRARIDRCDRFLGIFEREGCRMVEMSCAEHDRSAAGSQFVTHTMGRVLEKFGLESTPINTKGYETLLELVENTAGDSFDLYYGLFLYNQNAMEQLQRLDVAFESLKKELFGQLHQVYRKQLFESGNKPAAVAAVQKLLHNGAPPGPVEGAPETAEVERLN